MSVQTVLIYGIKNCNTMQKAFAWLNKHQIEYVFIDYKKQLPEKAKLIKWLEKYQLTALINTKGTTFKKLTDESKQAIMNEDTAALDLMLKYPSMIKRPIVEWGNLLLVGFDEESWKQLLL